MAENWEPDLCSMSVITYMSSQVGKNQMTFIVLYLLLMYFLEVFYQFSCPVVECHPETGKLWVQSPAVSKTVKTVPLAPCSALVFRLDPSIAQ